MKTPINLSNLSPFSIVRQKHGPEVFGYSKTQIEEKIRNGEIPTPIPLATSGRARGWTGQQIMDHRARCIAAAETLAAAKAVAPPTARPTTREARRDRASAGRARRERAEA